MDWICLTTTHVLQDILALNKLIALSMSANEFNEVPHTIGCKIPQGIEAVGKLTIIGSDNGLSPGRRQAII